MAVTVTNRGKYVLATNDAELLDIRTAVFVGTVPATGTIQDWNTLQDVIDSALVEAAATNYARQDLAGIAVAEDDTGNKATLTATRPTINSVGAGETWSCVAHYVFNASDALADLLAIDEPASTIATDGNNVQIPQLSIDLT